MAHFKVTAVAGLAAIALSGCSWLGLGGHDKAGSSLYAAQHGGAYGYTPGQAYGAGPAHAGIAANCQIPTPAHPVPAGCDPAAVTIGVPGAGGFSQTPQFGAVGSPAFASGAYGTHAGGGVHAPVAEKEARYRKPRLRGFLQSSVEKSISGENLDYSKIGPFDPGAAGYDPDLFRQLGNAGPVVDNGDGTSTFTADVYSAIVGDTRQPSISYDDVYSTPLTIGGGLEYILTPNTTVFANAGYAYSEGKGGPAATIEGDLTRRNTTFTTDNATGAIISEVPAATFARRNEQEDIATYDFDFTDLRRIDLEAGGRYYFQPLAKSGMPGVTPFIGAAAGASHHNSQSFTVSQTQAEFQPSFIADSTDGQFFDVVPAQLNGVSRVELYDAQWVPRGRLNAGVEWQASPSTAIAFETGLFVEGGKKYAPTGERGNANVSIPLTIRGSYNF